MRISSFFFFIMLCLAATLSAKDLVDDSIALLRSGEVYKGDYFATNHSVELSGVVEGDVYLMAAQAIIDGTIDGDLLIIGGSVELSGLVKGSVRILGGQVNISGTVRKNVSVLSANLQMPSSAKLEGNLIVIAGNADIAADVYGSARLAVSNLRFSATVFKDVSAYVGEMRLTSRAEIEGNLDYRSHDEAWIDPSAKIVGKTNYQPSLLHTLANWPILRGILIGSKVAGILMNFLYAFVLGWILIRLYPHKLEKTLDILEKRPLHSLGVGVVILVALPITCLLLLMTIVGVPFALTLLALNIIGFYTAKVFSILWVSNKIFKMLHFKPNHLSTLALGLFLYGILAAVPYFGTFISFAAMLFGLGALILAQGNKKASFLPSG